MFKNRGGGGDDYLARAGGWKIKKLFGRTRRSSWPKTIIARRRLTVQYRWSFLFCVLCTQYVYITVKHAVR